MALRQELKAYENMYHDFQKNSKLAALYVAFLINFNEFSARPIDLQTLLFARRFFFNHPLVRDELAAERRNDKEKEKLSKWNEYENSRIHALFGAPTYRMPSGGPFIEPGTTFRFAEPATKVKLI